MMEAGPLHILLVEDSEPDAEMIRRVMRDHDGLRLVRVAVGPYRLDRARDGRWLMPGDWVPLDRG